MARSAPPCHSWKCMRCNLRMDLHWHDSSFIQKWVLQISPLLGISSWKLSWANWQFCVFYAASSTLCPKQELFQKWCERTCQSLTPLVCIIFIFKTCQSQNIKIVSMDDQKDKTAMLVCVFSRWHTRPTLCWTQWKLTAAPPTGQIP